MKVQLTSNEFAKDFLNAYHPLRAGGCLRGAAFRFAGYEDSWPTFLAVFVHPRSRWKNYPVSLELTRLAWSPLANRSAATFLKSCLRLLRKMGVKGLVVTYALPGTEGVLYERTGFKHGGYSGGAPWSKRGPGERPTPETIGTGRKLKRYFYEVAG